MCFRLCTGRLDAQEGMMKEMVGGFGDLARCATSPVCESLILLT